MMPGVFNETSLLLLFVGSFISCCLQLVHVPSPQPDATAASPSSASSTS